MIATACKHSRAAVQTRPSSSSWVAVAVPAPRVTRKWRPEATNQRVPRMRFVWHPSAKVGLQFSRPVAHTTRRNPCLTMIACPTPSSQRANPESLSGPIHWSSPIASPVLLQGFWRQTFSIEANSIQVPLMGWPPSPKRTKRSSWKLPCQTFYVWPMQLASVTEWNLMKFAITSASAAFQVLRRFVAFEAPHDGNIVTCPNCRNFAKLPLRPTSWPANWRSPS